MTSPQARKGADWERAASKVYEDAGVVIYRPHQWGWQDHGDRQAPPFLFQMKNYGNIVTGLREGIAGAVKQAAASFLDYPVAVIKVARKPASEGLACMRLADHARLVSEHIEMRLRILELEGKLRDATGLPGNAGQSDRGQRRLAGNVPDARGQRPESPDRGVGQGQGSGPVPGGLQDDGHHQGSGPDDEGPGDDDARIGRPPW